MTRDHDPRLPFPHSKCHGCVGLRLVRGRGGAYLMCQRQTPKYRPQPVRECALFEPKA